jgi:hypothetical protein
MIKLNKDPDMAKQHETKTYFTIMEVATRETLKHTVNDQEQELQFNTREEAADHFDDLEKPSRYAIVENQHNV